MSEAHTADLGTRYRYRREGAELERERIIELLQTFPMEQWTKQQDGTFVRAASVESLIELIKGEQND